MKKNKLTMVGTVALAALTLTGCAASRQAAKDIVVAKDGAKNLNDGAKVRSGSSVLDGSDNLNKNFAKVNKAWVNPVPLPRDYVNKRANQLPEFFQQRVSYTIPGRVTLVEVISEIKRNQKIDVQISQDIYDKELRGSSGESSSIGDAEPLKVSDFVVKDVTLQEALDFLASKANISWNWDGEKISFFRYETKSYSINILPGKTESSSVVSLASETTTSSGGGGGSSSSGGTATATNNSGDGQAGSLNNSQKQGVSRTATIDSWDNVKKYIQPLLSKNGRLVVMEDAGLITVTDTQDVHRVVDKSVKDLNKVVNKQIYMKIDIYSVVADNSDDYGLDLNLAFSGSSNIGFTFNTQSGGSGTSIGTISSKNSNWDGTSAVAKALSKLGQASIVNQFNIATLSGQTTPVGNNSKIPFISGIEVQTDANGYPMQSIVTSSVMKGISINVMPKLYLDGRILVEFSMNLSDVIGNETLTTGGGANAQSLKLPQTTLSNILQRASLRSGQSMVLSAFKQSVASSEKSGTFTPNTPLLGGGTKANTKEQYLVVVVTPSVALDSE